jgi:hypothetical protein
MKVVCVDDSNLYFKDEDLYYNRMDDDKPLLDKDVVYSVRLRLIREEKLQKLGI